MNIDTTLSERGQRYGDFDEHARVTQAIKEAMATGANWLSLDPDQREALEMTAHKIGRILNGDPDYVDSWHDIIGYIRLVEQRLVAEQSPKLKPGAEAEPLSAEAFAERMKNLAPGMHIVFVSEDSGEAD